MDMTQLQEDYGAVLNELQKNDDFPAATEMSALFPVLVKIAIEEFATPDEAEKAIEAAEGTCEGWVRRQSLAAICPRDEDHSGGLPLAGEWLLDEDGRQSQHLTYDGRKWRVWTYEQVDETSDEGELFLAQETDLLFAREFTGAFRKLASAPQRLRYMIYWGRAKNGALIERRFARFIGFDAGMTKGESQ